MNQAEAAWTRSSVLIFTYFGMMIINDTSKFSTHRGLGRGGSGRE